FRVCLVRLFNLFFLL
ncbi:hypothetical protein EE612_002563, partial [Oryza sativa]